MTKTCLTKLRGNITQGCTITPVGVKNLYLMNLGDVSITTDTDVTAIASASIASGAVVILVEGYRQNIQITSAIRTTDASAKLDFSIMFKMAGRDTATISSVRSLLSGKFYVLAEYQDGTYSFLGYTSPLECSGMDWDSNANAGLMTVSLAAPEGSPGNYLMGALEGAVTTIKSKIGV